MDSNLLKEYWNSLKINDKTYLLKCLFNENDYELLLFSLNQCNLYYEKKSKNDIEKYLHKYNPSIEAPINKINMHLKNCFVSDTSCEFNERKHGNFTIELLLFFLSFVLFCLL
jgi:hypothetical protein